MGYIGARRIANTVSGVFGFVLIKHNASYLSWLAFLVTLAGCGESDRSITVSTPAPSPAEQNPRPPTSLFNVDPELAILVGTWQGESFSPFGKGGHLTTGADMRVELRKPIKERKANSTWHKMQLTVDKKHLSLPGAERVLLAIEKHVPGEPVENSEDWYQIKKVDDKNFELRKLASTNFVLTATSGDNGIDELQIQGKPLGGMHQIRMVLRNREIDSIELPEEVEDEEAEVEADDDDR